MTKRNQRSGLWGTVLPTTLGVAAMGIGVGVWAAGPYTSDGSDTLGDVAPTTIALSGANLTYRAMGSGQAETNMSNGTQSIGFMSRNFKSAVLTSHPLWQPATNNVLGLDAAVIVESSWASRMQNLSLPQDTTKPGKALPDSDLSLLLSGYQSAGTTDACRHPNRLAAIDRLTTALHVDQIDHMYRRNDASGTSDTIRERVLTTASGTSGGRFCNGQAPGGLKSDGVTLNHNLDAEDMDPIRRDCVAAVSGLLNATKCIYYPYNVACNAGDVASGVSGVPNGTVCTQGLVVALTDADPGSTDVTTSIARRVAGDDGHKTIGYAGREAVKTVGVATAGPTINKISYSDASIRQAFYPLSRRLFLNHGDSLPNSTNPTDANYDKQQQENTLYDYATGDNGRCNMAPIMKQFGFVSCHNNCNPSTWGSSYNLCEDGDISAAESTMALCVAAGKTCPTSGTMPICCSTGITCTSGATCGSIPAATQGQGCNTTADCATGLTCKADSATGYMECLP
jgi:hypothetical protein